MVKTLRNAKSAQDSTENVNSNTAVTATTCETDQDENDGDDDDDDQAEAEAGDGPVVPYFCDPVMGDNGKCYLPKELIEV